VVEHSPSVHTADLIEHGPRSRMHADLSEVTDNATALNDALPISEVHASRDGLLTQHFESDISEFERFPDVVGDEESSNQDAIQWKKWIRK
jgi:hypothetical protein